MENKKLRQHLTLIESQLTKVQFKIQQLKREIDREEKELKNNINKLN